MWRSIALAAAAFAGVAACGTVLDLEDYEIRASDAGTGGDTCFDPKGANGHGCFRCEAGTPEQVMNACTASPCYEFDDFARVPGFNGDAAALPDVVVDDVPEAAVSDTAIDAPATQCESFPSPVYVYGSTAMEGVLGVLAEQVPGRTIIYQPDASCRGIDAILTGDSKLVTTAKTVAYAGATVQPCQLGATRLADIGISDVEPRQCNGIGSTESITDLRGPIQVFMFAAPTASSQRAISAEAAFRVFGFGKVAGISPWLDDALIMRRHIASGTQITLSGFLDLPVDRWAGTRKQGSTQLATECAASPNPEATICITSADQRDFKFKDTLRNLAYRHRGQVCAYLPDSIEGGVDKKNVRDGHYALWAPVHFFVRNGAITNDAIRDVLNALTGAKLPADKAAGYFTAFKTAGLVPACAMSVGRDTDYGPLKAVLRDVPCGCGFEAAGSGIPAGCRPCTSKATCAADETCSFGFCERAKP